LEVGALQIEDNEVEVIHIGGIHVEQLLPETNKHIKDNVMLDGNH